MQKGRPPKKPAEVKTSYVRFRVTPDERSEIKRRAKAARTPTVSDWMRDRLLGEN